MSQTPTQEEITTEEVELSVEQDVVKVEPIQPSTVVLNATELREAAGEVADESSVNNFTAPVSGINHGHAPDKHDVRQAFSVRDEFVSEFFSEFGIAPNDHAALWLLSYRQDEAIAHDKSIFSDAPDTDSRRWQRIEDAKTKAPIAPRTHEQLKP